MTCNSCGSTNIRQEDFGNVCKDCGNVEGPFELTLKSGISIYHQSTFVKFDAVRQGRPYRAFHDLYYSCAVLLNAPSEIMSAGKFLLPDVWDAVKGKQYKSKKIVLLAMLYLLFRQHNFPVTFNQFFKQSHCSSRMIFTSIQFIKKKFNMGCPGLDMQDIIATNIPELVRLVFKNPTTQMEHDAIHLAQRLAAIIHQKEWGDAHSKNYANLVAASSTLLAAQYVVSNLTHRKTQHGVNASFRCMTLNYQKIADYVCIHAVTVKRFTKVVQHKLFELASELPWVAASVKRTLDVARMLVDLIDYVDIDIHEPEDTTFSYEIPWAIKKRVVAALQCYIRTRKMKPSGEFPLNLMEFWDILNGELKLEKCNSSDDDGSRKPSDDDSSNNSTDVSMPSERDDPSMSLETGALPQEGSTGNCLEVAVSELASSYKHVTKSKLSLKGDELIVHGYNFKLAHLELLKDLLVAGCTVKELEKDDYISLVQKYIDMPCSEGTIEEEIEDLNDEEVLMYFNDPTIFGEKVDKIEEAS